jgi:hypothetical protein
MSRPVAPERPDLSGVPKGLRALVPSLLENLEQRPYSSRELGWVTSALRAVEKAGLIELDPDRFPEEYVPGNPLVARLPGDTRPWPGWKHWNV